jgi:hypothetical protein
VGISGANHEQTKINPSTLQRDDKNGIYLQTKHLHAALREVLGIQSHPLAQRYDLKAEALPLFNPAVASGITV